MGRVRVLTEGLVSLISAGEVIENPSSIVKELIENSMDAEADSIEIEVKGGGIDYISVSDNGIGILREDCGICLQRYSTSKIAAREDIDAIRTYGFRGEALASIAAVAEVKITTQTSEEEIGTEIHCRAGEKPAVADASRPRGTRVEVFNLFEKVPARRKHLGSRRAENYKISEIVMKHALARPDIGFRLTRDGETVFDCPPYAEIADRVRELWGKDISDSMVPVEHSDDSIRVSGYVARPPVSRGNRSRQYFSVLKRPILDPRLSETVESVFHSLLMKGQYPICVLDISLDHSRVDVNVHPTKREVRILDFDSTLSVLRDAVQNSLMNEPGVPDETRLEDFYPDAKKSTEQEAPQSPVEEVESPLDSVQLLEQTIIEAAEATETETSVEFLTGTYRVLGQLHKMYILLESDEGLLIVDQHAAHERILYEQLRKEIEQDAIHVQELLEPVILSLGTNEAERILELEDALHEVGYTVEGFGGNEIAVSSVPAIFESRADARELLAFIGRAVEVDLQTARGNFLDEIAKLTACHSAIRAGQRLSHDEMARIIRNLAQLRRRYNCCHGRPSMVRLTRKDIDRKVGRLGPDAIKRYKARRGLE